MLNQFLSRNNCETEAKFIQGRIQSVERNLAEFCNVFAQYSRKAARIRDKGDELTRITLNMAENETINKSLALGLENFADCVTQIGDYGDLRVQTIDTKVVGELTKYEDICKHAKEEVREIYNSRDKEILKKRHLDRLREHNPRNRHQIIQAETELVKATAEVSKSIHTLEDKTNNFEKQKLHDIKTILLNFITTEMGYHAKCLEILTKGFADIQAINEEADLERVLPSDYPFGGGSVMTWGGISFEARTHGVSVYQEWDFAHRYLREVLEDHRVLFMVILGARPHAARLITAYQEFKSALHLPDAVQQKSLGRRSLFRSTGSLGSLGMVFSSNHNNKRIPGIPNINKLSKSDETLDSMKHSITDTEDSETEGTVQDISTTSEDYNEDETSDTKPSPAVVRKFKK